jgi:hypothetical protein
VLQRELAQLDAQDFVHAARCEFLLTHLDLGEWVRRWPVHESGQFVNAFNQDPSSRERTKNLMKRTIAVLEKYGGEGWRATTRSFAFVKDQDLRDIIERDYKELTLVLFPGRAWKSTVVMAGSILEAILFDLFSDPAIDAKALASAAGQKVKKKDWGLDDLITIAAEIGVLPPKRADTFDQVLRDYRNFVHPKKEIRAGHPCGEGEAQLAIGGLNAVCDHLTKTIK